MGKREVNVKTGCHMPTVHPGLARPSRSRRGGLFWEAACLVGTPDWHRHQGTYQMISTNGASTSSVFPAPFIPLLLAHLTYWGHYNECKYSTLLVMYPYRENTRENRSAHSTPHYAEKGTGIPSRK